MSKGVYSSVCADMWRSESVVNQSAVSQEGEDGDGFQIEYKVAIQCFILEYFRSGRGASFKYQEANAPELNRLEASTHHREHTYCTQSMGVQSIMTSAYTGSACTGFCVRVLSVSSLGRRTSTIS